MFLTPEAVSPNTELILNGGSLLVRDFTISPRKITAKHGSDFGYVRSPGSINSLEVILESGQSNVPFVGEGAITKITPGTFTLQYKAKPDFTGTYVIQEGTLTVAQNSLGEGTTIVEALGQLRPSDSTLRANIRLDGGDLVNPNLRQLTLEIPNNTQAGVIEVVSDSTITIMHPSSLTHLNMPLVLDPGVTLERRGGGELRVNSDLMLGDGATLALNEGLLWTSARSAIIVGQETSIESTGVLTLSGTLVAAGVQSTLSLDANAVLESSWGLRVPQHTSLSVTQAATPLDVAVGRGQFLAGGGGVNNNLTVADNAIIEPGDVVGTLTIDGNVTIAAARFKFQFHDAAGLPGATNGWDLVDVVENLTFEHERHKRIRMEVTGVDATGQNAGVANFDPTVSRSFALLSAASITGYDTSRFDLTVTGFDNDHPLPNGAEFSLRGVDGEVLLDYNVVFGDFDGDQTLGALDITLLGQEIVSGSTDLSWDVNYDNQLNEEDRSFWVHEIVETYFGDANVDGEFDSSDLVEVFRAGEYEDELAMNSNWATGDWDGDAEFNTTDLVLAFQDGGYELGPRVEVSAVPEPAAFVVLLAGLIGVGVWRRRPWS